MSKITKNYVLLSCLFMSACGLEGEINYKNRVIEGGYTPLAEPKHLVRCYDYQSDVTFEASYQKKDLGVVLRPPNLRIADGEISASNNNDLYDNATGGVGCIHRKDFIDMDNPENIELIKGVRDSAEYDVIITNGFDYVFLRNKFTNVSYGVNEDVPDSEFEIK